MKRSELFVLPSSISKLFLPNGTENPNVDNIDYYPRHLQPFYGNLHIINANTSTLGEDSFGNLVAGWNPNQRNSNLVTDIVNNFPRHMLQNLVVIAGKDGTAIPVAGSYFTKMMDHEPGTIEPFSCLITDENGEIGNLAFNKFTITDKAGSVFASDSSELKFKSTSTIDVDFDNGEVIFEASPSFNSVLIADINETINATENNTALTLSGGNNISLEIGTNGEIIINSTSAGGGGGTKTYAVYTPLNNQPPATNFATIDTRNSIMVLEFNDSTDESAVFVGVMPESASLASGLQIRIHWMADTATSGICRWGVQIERMNTDLDSDSFDTAATAGSTTSGTSGIITTTSITITTIDGVTAGDPFRLKIYRDADGTSGTDSMTGDAQLVVVEVRSGA